MTGSIVFFPRGKPGAGSARGRCLPGGPAGHDRLSQRHAGHVRGRRRTSRRTRRSQRCLSVGRSSARIQIFGEVRTTLAFGTWGHTEAASPAEFLADGRMQFIEPGSLEEGTLGGHPAAIFIDTNGAWPSRVRPWSWSTAMYTRSSCSRWIACDSRTACRSRRRLANDEREPGVLRPLALKPLLRRGGNAGAQRRLGAGAVGEGEVPSSAECERQPSTSVAAGIRRGYQAGGSPSAPPDEFSRSSLVVQPASAMPYSVQANPARAQRGNCGYRS